MDQWTNTRIKPKVIPPRNFATSQYSCVQ